MGFEGLWYTVYGITYKVYGISVRGWRGLIEEGEVSELVGGGCWCDEGRNVDVALADAR